MKGGILCSPRAERGLRWLNTNEERENEFEMSFDSKEGFPNQSFLAINLALIQNAMV